MINWKWVWWKLINMNLFALSYMELFLDWHYLLKILSFFYMHCCSLSKRWNDCITVGLYVHPQFYFIDQCMCFCVSTRLFLLLQFYSISLIFGMMISPAVLLLFKIASVILSLLCFQLKFEIVFSISMKNCVEILVWIALNL